MPFLVLAFAGVLVLVWRMTPRRPRPLALPKGPDPLVSIVVPARNEEAALPRLLDSLRSLDYPRYEVIVVDDCSDDRTAEVARAAGARVVAGKPLEAGFRGKQWACWQGAQAAKGEIFLFTDADTAHARDSLARAVRYLRASGADLVTALPFHDCLSPWEKLSGPFHVMLLALTAPYARPRPGRVFAIGQYLMTTKSAYTATGGHQAVKDELVEDVPLANVYLRAGRELRVIPGERFYRVRMYATPAAFLAGWRRNFRAGLGATSHAATVEMVAIAAALTGGGQLFATPWALLPPVLAAAFCGWRQRRLGDFHGLGAVLAPLSLAVFCLVTALALADMILKRPLRWKDRSYPAPA